MQKFKIKLTQLLLVFILILVTAFISHDAVNTVAVAASDPLPPTVIQPPNVSDILDSAAATATNCRYGVSQLDDKDFKVIEDLGLGWTLNFTTSFNPKQPDGVEYTPMIRFKPELDANNNRTGNYRVVTHKFTDAPGGLGPIIAANPGQLWLVGNEVDRKVYQDDLMPNVYAKAYHDAYHFIKERDPSAQVAISGLVQVTPGRLQYLDIVWDIYLATYGTPMPVDVWNMHIYILPEKRQTVGSVEDAAAAVALGTDPTIAIWESDGTSTMCSALNVYCHAEHDDMNLFKEQVVAMRQWMKDHGQQNKPLILSEYSLLHPYDQEGDNDPNTCYLKDEYGNCFTPERVSKFMVDSFAYLETATDPALGFPVDNNRLVQQWLWFAVKWYGTFSSNLVEEGYTETGYTYRLPGQTFQTHLDGLRPFSSHPIATQANDSTAKTVTPTGTISATIGATIYNNGNTHSNPITVNFYADAAKTQLIGTATMVDGLAGCAMRAGQAEIVWDDLSTGVHPYWAEVEGGNTVKGIVIINPIQVYLPNIIR